MNETKIKKVKIYRHLFFDLDRTLWDYDKNANEALAEILELHGLMPVFKNVEQFWKSFEKHNDELWDLYRNGIIKKEYLRDHRFELTMNDFGTSNPELAQKLNEDFLKLSPKKTGLVDGAIDLLSYLKTKRYRMHILTNGFTHIQNLKMKESGLQNYFEHLFTSDKIGTNKPNRRMFEYAVKCVNAKKSESLMIGDDLRVDILGAQGFGMDQVYYNPSILPHQENPTFEISSLSELKMIL